MRVAQLANKERKLGLFIVENIEIGRRKSIVISPCA